MPGSRDRRAGVLRRLPALLIYLLLPVAAHATGSITGVSALAAGEPSVSGEMVVTPRGTPLDLKIDVMFHRPDDQQPLKRFETLAGRQLDFEIVSDDLQHYTKRQIAHVIDGHGQTWVRFPEPGLYHLYVTGTPRSMSSQVLRFDVTVGDPEPAPPRALGGPMTEARIGPYTAHFDSLALAANAANSINLHIAEDGKPAHNLRPAEGTPVQAFLVAVDDLHIVPVTVTQPEAASSGSSTPPDNMTLPPDISFTVPAASPGTYRLFVAFNGGRIEYTAPFVAVVK